MTKFLIRRTLQAIPTMFGITILAYLVMVAAPGDPAMLLSRNPKWTVAQRQAYAERLGVNDSVIEQYFRWLVGDTWKTYRMVDHDGEVTYEHGHNRGILRGDFGNSFTANRPATEVIIEKIPATLELATIAFVVSLALGLLIGLLAAVQQGGAFDQFSRVLAVIFSAVPVFWLGLILILVFGSWLHWLPMGNRYPTNSLTRDFSITTRIKHLILPVTVLSTGGIAVYSRFMRAAVLDILGQDYVRTAKAKGLENRAIWIQHAARNALIPIVTIAAPAIPGLIGGAIITETIFSWPGMGRQTLSSVLQQDYPVVMFSVILAGMGTILGYLLTDVLYAVVDPRVRLQ